VPTHSSHILQLLDVACFSHLKLVSGWQVKRQASLSINHNIEVDFLSLYHVAHVQGIAEEENIKAGFAAVGLLPFNHDRVLMVSSLTVLTQCLLSAYLGSPSLSTLTQLTWETTTHPCTHPMLTGVFTHQLSGLLTYPCFRVRKRGHFKMKNRQGDTKAESEK
jgi:hypothetical protein